MRLQLFFCSKEGLNGEGEQQTTPMKPKLKFVACSRLPVSIAEMIFILKEAQKNYGKDIKLTFKRSRINKAWMDYLIDDSEDDSK